MSYKDSIKAHLLSRSFKISKTKYVCYLFPDILQAGVLPRAYFNSWLTQVCIFLSKVPEIEVPMDVLLPLLAELLYTGYGEGMKARIEFSQGHLVEGHASLVIEGIENTPRPKARKKFASSCCKLEKLFKKKGFSSRTDSSPIHIVSHYTGLSYSAKDIRTDVECMDLKCLPRRLTCLDLSHQDIEGKNFRHLSLLANLTSLNLQHTYMLGPFSEILTGMTLLRALDFGHFREVSATGIHSFQLNILHHLTGLKALACEGCEIDVKYITMLTDLTFLNLGSNYICTEGVKALSHLTNLRSLNLGKNGMRLGSIGYLTRMTNLRRLDVRSNFAEIRDDLQILSSLTNLVELYAKGKYDPDEMAGEFKDLRGL